MLRGILDDTSALNNSGIRMGRVLSLEINKSGYTGWPLRTPRRMAEEA